MSRCGLDVERMDALERAGHVDGLLDVTDGLLRDRLGLSVADTAALRVIWRKLSDRRVNRKGRSGRPVSP